MYSKSLIYICSSIISAAIPFILLPILTRYLTPTQYGEIAMYSIFTTALAAVVGLSVHGAANRRYFDEGVSSNEISRFNGNCLIILFFSALFSLFLLTFLDKLLSKYLSIPVNWIYLGLISVFCVFILNIRLGQWQIRGKAKSFGLLQVTNAFIVLILSLIFVVLFELGPDGRIYGIVITGLVIAAFSYIALRKDKLVSFELNKVDLAYALSFGVPLIPHVLGGFLLLSIDRLVINKTLGLEATGIYMVAINLGNAINIIFSSINKAYSPWLFGELKKNNYTVKKSIVKKTYMYFTLLIVLALLSFIVAPPILKLVVGENFHSAAEILPLIITGQIFLGMYLVVTNYIFYIKKTKFLSYVTITSGVINVALLLFLIPEHGIRGAALAFLIANLWQFSMIFILSAKLYKMPWVLWR